MPIPQLPLLLPALPYSPSEDGVISLDREILLQVEALVSQHVPGFAIPFSIASVVVVSGGYTNRYAHFLLNLRTLSCA